jgi:hypothetical protein
MADIYAVSGSWQSQGLPESVTTDTIIIGSDVTTDMDVDVAQDSDTSSIDVVSGGALNVQADLTLATDASPSIDCLVVSGGSTLSVSGSISRGDGVIATLEFATQLGGNNTMQVSGSLTNLTIRGGDDSASDVAITVTSTGTIIGCVWDVSFGDWTLTNAGHVTFDQAASLAGMAITNQDGGHVTFLSLPAAMPTVTNESGGIVDLSALSSAHATTAAESVSGAGTVIMPAAPAGPSGSSLGLSLIQGF